MIKPILNRCFNSIAIISLIELFLDLSGFILIIVGCIKNCKMNDTANIWVPIVVSGMILGCIIGEIYWKKIKKPFFIEYFPEQYQMYLKDIQHWSPAKVRYRNAATVENVLYPLTALCFAISIIIVYLI